MSTMDRVITEFKVGQPIDPEVALDQEQTYRFLVRDFGSRAIGWLIDTSPQNAHEFINGWVAYDVDEVEWPFPVWDPADGRFEPRASQPI